MVGGATLVDSADLTPVPWRNGAGLTRELQVGQGWRLSLADLTSPVPFSAMPGHDRIHLPLGGAYTLRVGGDLHSARRFEPIAFPGETPVCLHAVEESASALNLITQRGTCSGSLVVARVDGPAVWPPTVRTVVLLGGDAPVVATADEGPLFLDLGNVLVAEVRIHEPFPQSKEIHP